MGMLEGMKYLNVRHELPQIGIRQQQARTEKAGFEPAKLSRDYKPPLADVAATQVIVDIDTYQCRKPYGFLNGEDFARKYGQAGLQNLAKITSSHTQDGWDNIMNAATPNSKVIEKQADARLRAWEVDWPTWESVLIPPPTFTVQPSEIVGQVDPGSDKMHIEATGDADLSIKPGSAETYMDKEGWIRMYVTTGSYDVSV